MGKSLAVTKTFLGALCEFQNRNEKGKNNYSKQLLLWVEGVQIDGEQTK